MKGRDVQSTRLRRPFHGFCLNEDWLKDGKMASRTLVAACLLSVAAAYSPSVHLANSATEMIG